MTSLAASRLSHLCKAESLPAAAAASGPHDVPTLANAVDADDTADTVDTVDTTVTDDAATSGSRLDSNGVDGVSCIPNKKKSKKKSPLICLTLYN